MKLLKIKNIIYLFLALLDLHCFMGFSFVVVSGGSSLLQSVGFSCGAQALGCAGFSCCNSCALERRLDSYGAWA